MKAVLEGRTVRLGPEGIALYEQSGYGRPEKGSVRLSPEEALYLIHRNRIEVPDWDFDRLLGLFAKDPNFFRRFLVYRDLRERGYAVQTGPHDFRVFRRGERPGTGESRYTVRVLSEQDLADFGRLIAEAGTSVRMRKTYLIAVVDDENELTYYDVKVQPLPSVGESPECAPFRARLAGGTAFIAPGEAGPEGCEPYGMRLDPDRLVLSPFEILQMAHSGTITLIHEGEAVDLEEFTRAASRGDPEFAVKARVFEDLRRHGYIPRTGYKFGHHFRVYSGQKPHSELLVHAIPGDAALPMSVVSRSVRLAHSVKKKMLFGCVHSTGIQYIEFARIRL